jgi:hypothetical protein
VRCVIYLVVGPGVVVLAAYTRADSAFLHARCVTGAEVVQRDLFERVPDSVRSDIASDVEFEDAGDTPVISVDDLPDIKLEPIE